MIKGCLSTYFLRKRPVIEIECNRWFVVVLSSDIKVLHDQVGCAVIDEATAGIRLVKERLKLLGELSFAVLLEDHLLLRFDNGKTLVEHLTTVLLTHEGFEFRESAGWDIDHFLFAHSTSDITILSVIIYCRALLALCSSLDSLRDIRSLGKVLNIILVAILTDIRSIPLHSLWRHRCSRLRIVLRAGRLLGRTRWRW